MKARTLCLLLFAVSVTPPVFGGESNLSPSKWSVRFDLGGTIPENPSLNLWDGPVTGGDQLDLDAGVAMNVAFGYRLTPWLLVEGELGFAYNGIDSVGNWSYPDSSLSQLTMMVNVVIERPQGPLIPFAGIGAGGVFSSLSFGSYYYYYYSDADGYGTDFVPAAQAFAGLRYAFSPSCSAGLTYRFLVTDRQKWDVDWWDGNDFVVGVDSFALPSICLEFAFRF
jgi:opacity protein-like surface antigen